MAEGIGNNGPRPIPPSDSGGRPLEPDSVSAKVSRVAARNLSETPPSLPPAPIRTSSSDTPPEKDYKRIIQDWVDSSPPNLRNDYLQAQEAVKEFLGEGHAIKPVLCFERLRIQTLPDIWDHPVLQKRLLGLTIYGCSRLTSIPESIAICVNLQIVGVEKSANFTSFPACITNFPNLRALKVTDCPNFTTFPKDIENCLKLVNVTIDGCARFTALPEGIGNCAALRKLSLQRNTALTDLPTSIFSLHSSCSINLSGCRFSDVVMSHLWEAPTAPNYSGPQIILDGPRPPPPPPPKNYASIIQDWVDNSPPELRSDYVKVQEILSSHLKSNIHGSVCFENLRIQTLPDIWNHLPLQGQIDAITFVKCANITSILDSLGTSRHLTELSIKDCDSLRSLPESSGNWVNLQKVLIMGCADFRSFPESMANCANLHTIELHNCINFTDFPTNIGDYPALLKVGIFQCPNFTSFPSTISNCATLRELGVIECSNFTSFPEDIHGPNIEALTVIQSLNFTGFPAGIANCPNLRYLGAKDCPNFTDCPEGIEKCLNLTHLGIVGCARFSALPENIGNCSSLTVVSLESCTALTGLPFSIFSLPSSCEIDLIGCRFSDVLFSHLKGATTAPNYSGPRIIFEAPPPPPPPTDPFYIPPVEESLKEIYDRAGLLQPDLSSLSIDPEKNRWLAMWLKNLSLTIEGGAKQIHPERSKAFYQLITKKLELAQTNPAFTPIFWGNVEEGRTTCGDRIYLSLLNMGIAINLIEAESEGYGAVLQCLKQIWILSLLAECAKEKAATCLLNYEIEIYLAYPVKLKEKLKLDLDVEEMLYFHFTSITNTDLKVAEAYVQSKLAHPDALANYLIEQPAWIAALEKEYPEKMADIKHLRETTECNTPEEYIALGEALKGQQLELTLAAIKNAPPSSKEKLESYLSSQLLLAKASDFSDNLGTQLEGFAPRGIKSPEDLSSLGLLRFGPPLLALKEEANAIAITDVKGQSENNRGVNGEILSVIIALETEVAELVKENNPIQMLSAFNPLYKFNLSHDVAEVQASLGALKAKCGRPSVRPDVVQANKKSLQDLLENLSALDRKRQICWLKFYLLQNDGLRFWKTAPEKTLSKFVKNHPEIELADLFQLGLTLPPA